MKLSVVFSLRALPLVFAAALGSCATQPFDASHPRGQAGVPVQPLTRIDVAPDLIQRDLLANLLAGELALANADVEGAARAYAQAAQTSADPAIAEQATHVAIAGKQWDVARAALARWQALNGDDLGIRQSRAMIALHDGQADAAYADLKELARLSDGAGWRAIAQALSAGGSKLAAGAMLQRLLGGDLNQPAAKADESLGSKPEIWIAISQLALRLERRDIARALAEQAVTRFPNVETYVWAAQIKLGDGDKSGASRLFAVALRDEKIVKGKRSDRDRSERNHSEQDIGPRLRLAYASLLADSGDAAQAARVLAQGPQSDFTFAARAAYLARDEVHVDRAQVEALYKQVLAAAEPRPPARVQLLGQLSELLERKADALKWYAQIPEDAEPWFATQMRTAILLNDTGKTIEAANLLHELQAHSGDDSKSLGEAFLLEADLLVKNNHREDALLTYDRGMQVLPDDTRLLYARALLNEDLGHTDLAVRDLRRVLELKPNDADAMNALGYTLADRTDRIAEAQALIEKALALKPGDPALIDSLGWVQYRLGNLDVAQTQLRTAYAKQPDPEIAAHLGEVLWKLGRKDEARQVWDQGRKKDADNKVLVETIKRLAS